MKRIITDWATRIELEDDEAKEICRLGQGEECCAFLVVSAKGLECIKMSYPFSATIFDRLEKGTMNAKGRGEWPGCPWANGGRDDITKSSRGTEENQESQ